MRLAPPTPCGSAGETSHLPSLLHTGTGTLAHHYCSPLLPPLCLSSQHCHSLHLRVGNTHIVRDNGEVSALEEKYPVMRLYHSATVFSGSSTVLPLWEQLFRVVSTQWHTILCKHHLRKYWVSARVCRSRADGSYIIMQYSVPLPSLFRLMLISGQSITPCEHPLTWVHGIPGDSDKGIRWSHFSNMQLVGELFLDFPVSSPSPAQSGRRGWYGQACSCQHFLSS